MSLALTFIDCLTPKLFDEEYYLMKNTKLHFSDHIPLTRVLPNKYCPRNKLESIDSHVLCMEVVCVQLNI